MNSAIQHLSNWAQCFRYEQDLEQPHPQGISLKKAWERSWAAMLKRWIALSTIWETNCAHDIHWIEIYPVDNVIYLLKNGSLA